MKSNAWRALRGAYGIGRSLAMYYGIPGRRERLKRFYQTFLKEGDLAFDIGAHVGNRVRAFRDCGARVVALEPQPRFFELLERLYGDDPHVELHPWGASDHEGRATLFISSATPTVTTFSSEWIESVRVDPRFRSIHWDESRAVPLTTLDELIALHGMPTFCKIDVEGLEYQVLAGLSHALPALCFEYIPVTSRKAIECVERLEDLGRYCYNLSPRETFIFDESDWVDAGGIVARLRRLPVHAPSGDVYARLLHGYKP